CDAHGLPGCPELCFRSQKALIRNTDLLFESVECWIVIDLPPFSADRSVARLRLLPARRKRLLIRGRHRGGGPVVLRADHATAQKKHDHQRENIACAHICGSTPPIRAGRFHAGCAPESTTAAAGQSRDTRLAWCTGSAPG